MLLLKCKTHFLIKDCHEKKTFKFHMQQMLLTVQIKFRYGVKFKLKKLYKLETNIFQTKKIEINWKKSK